MNFSHNNTIKVYEYPSWYVHYTYAVKLLELVLCSYFLSDMTPLCLILTSINRSIWSYYMTFLPIATLLQLKPKNHFVQGLLSREVAHIFRQSPLQLDSAPCYVSPISEHFAQIGYLHSMRTENSARKASGLARVCGKHLWEGTSIPSTLSYCHSAK